MHGFEFFSVISFYLRVPVWRGLGWRMQLHGIVHTKRAGVAGIALRANTTFIFIFTPERAVVVFY